MKCYLCHTVISRAMRKFMDAKNRREKAQYRDLCESCYIKSMNEEGYYKINNVWTKLDRPEITVIDGLQKGD